MHTHIRTHPHTSTHVFTHTHTSTHLFVHIYTHPHTYLHTHTPPHTSTHIHIITFTHLHTFIHTSIHTCTLHTHLQTCICAEPVPAIIDSWARGIVFQTPLEMLDTPIQVVMPEAAPDPPGNEVAFPPDDRSSQRCVSHTCISVTMFYVSIGVHSVDV